jgi:hypothetical protein
VKGVIRADHIAVNKYKLLVVGLPVFTFTKVSGIEDELETVDLPDRTTASGGNRKSTEMECEMPMHHLVEQAAMELWYKISQDPVDPLYKKPCTLIMQSISGLVVKTHQLIGVYPFKRVLPELEMVNEGELAITKWSFKIDDVLPI